MRTLCVFLLASGLAVAQFDQDSITIVSTAVSPTPPPGTITLSVDVLAPGGTGFDEILSALAPVGVSEHDLIRVDPSSPAGCQLVTQPLSWQCNPALAWRFGFTAPVSGLPEMLAKLARAAAAAKPGTIISYSANSGSPANAPDCAYPALISTARRHAENLAAAAGLRVGKVTALSDGFGQPEPASSLVVPTSVVRVGEFGVLSNPSVGLVGFADFLLGPPPTVAPTMTCPTVVQFQLLR
jgi:hypothetical protein